MMKWKDAIANGKLKLAAIKAIHPNMLAWVDENPRVGAVVVSQSDTDFALGQAALSYVTQAKAEGRLDEGIVVLVHKLGNRYEYVNAATAEEVTQIVSELPLRNGSWGPYWWLPATIKVVPPF
jgi:hypothetical protein